MAKPIILLYNLNNTKGKKIEKLCFRLKIEIKHVDASSYLEPVGFLAEIPGIDGNGQVYNGDPFMDEMLVMSGFSDDLLNRFLKEFKIQHIDRVALKAIITSQNKTWNSLELNKELNRAREALG